MSRIIFVTGTDTGVGKTLLTALLLQHLRTSGGDTLAMKPFCSGGRRDIEILQSIQARRLPGRLVNPYYFPEPVAPLVSARRHRQVIRPAEAIQKVREMASLCDCLIVEGSGGVLVPLAKDFCVADLIASLKCETIVVGRDKLGTLNHTCLTVEALRARNVQRLKIVLMQSAKPDASTRDNAGVLAELLAPARVFRIPNLGRRIDSAAAILRVEKKIKKTLARIADSASFSPR